MLHFDREKCVDCRICQEVCSFRFTNAIHPSVAAIRIGRDEGKWGTPFAMVCDLCQDYDTHQCVEACPEEALTFSGDVILWDEDLCTMCEDCVEACPQKAVGIDRDEGRINICDLCGGGTPLCIEWCPEEVITL